MRSRSKSTSLMVSDKGPRFARTTTHRVKSCLSLGVRVELRRPLNGDWPRRMNNITGRKSFLMRKRRFRKQRNSWILSNESSRCVEDALYFYFVSFHMFSRNGQKKQRNTVSVFLILERSRSFSVTWILCKLP